MNFIIAIGFGLIIAILSNMILDYLPYTRIYQKRISRKFTIRGGEPFAITLKPGKPLDFKQLFAALPFPYCPHCTKKKSWKSYLSPLACENCGRYDLRYRILLITLPVLFLLESILKIGGFHVMDMEILLAFYTIVFVMDIEHRMILFPVTVFGILFGLYFGFSYHPWSNTLFGGLAGGGIMLVFYLFGEMYVGQIRKHRNPDMNEVALGFGDVTLCLILGFILGWPGILGGLFFGIVIGGVISGLLLLIKLITKKYAPNDLILPYAPFLILGALLIMLF